MEWGDGAIYKGFWVNGVQNGLGLMKFANGLSKAGVFKDNVLMDLLYDENQMQIYEAMNNCEIPDKLR